MSLDLGRLVMHNVAGRYVHDLVVRLVAVFVVSRHGEYVVAWHVALNVVICHTTHHVFASVVGCMPFVVVAHHGIVIMALRVALHVVLRHVFNFFMLFVVARRHGN